MTKLENPEEIVMSVCASCDRPTPLHLLDAKPGPGPWTALPLSEAASSGLDFDRLECAECYGPNYVEGDTTNG